MKTVQLTPDDLDNSRRSRSWDNLNNSGALPALPQKILCDDAIGRRPLSFGESVPSARKWVDDTRPLSSRPSTPTITNFPPQTASSLIAQLYSSANPPVSQPVPQREQPARFNVNGSARSYAYGSTSRSHDNKGWTEYTHPEGGLYYYVNEDNRAITDFDFRGLTKLDEVSNTIDASDDVPEGCEMWIRAGSNAKKGCWKQKGGGDPAVLWVDHRHRRVLSEAPSDDYVQSRVDDRLDEEYRYWAFIEMHPAHIPRGIVESARKDAIDVLYWSYTEHLIHTHLPPTSLPFSQDECRKLIELLNGPNYPIIPAYTWTVDRILLRVVRRLIPIPIQARWRQVNFRPSAWKWVDDVPRPTSSFGLGSEHDTVASVDRHIGTNSVVLGSLGQAIPLDSKTNTTNVPEWVIHPYLYDPVPENVTRDAGPPSFSPGSLITTQISYGSASTPNFISDRNILRDVTAKDPEALLDTHNFNVTDASQTDTSIIAIALITALGLLTSHSSNPKVAVFQLSAAAVSFTLITLHSFHSKTLADTEQHPRELTLVQRLLKYFPPFIFVSCWILFLLSITFTFPKPMSVAVCLVVFASIPMVCGARLSAALTLAVITLFTLTFFTLVFLVCVLPTEWLV
ncbi:hypothetical protein JVT61DRAFT_6074 [Boletus reticuloceps]|uniref:Uncharacterized protein n=1 Tax=Boletus reticuloceps TaxID=495285 RepID=A0A8I2YL95_9AGAM|nr:hypothetical protein JVT61DRAFT_6074 [Boletus reticuloceps]